MQIRDARDEDLAGITAIYNDAVANTAAIWNETQVDIANRKQWLQDRHKLGYPVLVAIDDHKEVVGYASFGDWRAFDGYRHTVEHSVYVRNDQYRGGIGKALMMELIERARAIGKHAMVAGIEAGNVASIRLHENSASSRSACSRRSAQSSGGGWIWPSCSCCWTNASIPIP